MIEIVPFAFIGTYVTCFGAECADFNGEFAAAPHRRDCKPANCRTVDVQLDATRKQRDLSPSKRRVSTVVASQGAVVAMLNVIRVLFWQHVGLLLHRIESTILNASRDISDKNSGLVNNDGGHEAQPLLLIRRRGSCWLGVGIARRDVRPPIP